MTFDHHPHFAEDIGSASESRAKSPDKDPNAAMLDGFQMRKDGVYRRGGG